MTSHGDDHDRHAHGHSHEKITIRDSGLIGLIGNSARKTDDDAMLQTRSNRAIILELRISTFAFARMTFMHSKQNYEIERKTVHFIDVLIYIQISRNANVILFSRTSKCALLHILDIYINCIHKIYRLLFTFTILIHLHNYFTLKIQCRGRNLH